MYLLLTNYSLQKNAVNGTQIMTYTKITNAGEKPVTNQGYINSACHELHRLVTGTVCLSQNTSLVKGNCGMIVFTKQLVRMMQITDQENEFEDDDDDDQPRSSKPTSTNASSKIKNIVTSTPVTSKDKASAANVTALYSEMLKMLVKKTKKNTAELANESFDTSILADCTSEMLKRNVPKDVKVSALEKLEGYISDPAIKALCAKLKK